MTKGKIFIVSGPSGVGKDTLIREIMANTENLEFSISSTTRNPRGNPEEDCKYNFITKEDFEKGISENGFLEYAKYCENYYGTPAKPIEDWTSEGKNVLIECEVVGKEKLEKVLPEARSVFILPPSMASLKRRLIRRGTDSQDVIEARVNEAGREIEHARRYDFVVINDDLNKAVADFQNIINGNHITDQDNNTIINEVLKNV